MDIRDAQVRVARRDRSKPDISGHVCVERCRRGELQHRWARMEEDEHGFQMMKTNQNVHANRPGRDRAWSRLGTTDESRENVEIREGRVRVDRRDRRKPDISGHVCAERCRRGELQHRWARMEEDEHGFQMMTMDLRGRGGAKEETRRCLVGRGLVDRVARTFLSVKRSGGLPLTDRNVRPTWLRRDGALAGLGTMDESRENVEIREGRVWGPRRDDPKPDISGHVCVERGRRGELQHRWARMEEDEHGFQKMMMDLRERGGAKAETRRCLVGRGLGDWVERTFLSVARNGGVALTDRNVRLTWPGHDRAWSRLGTTDESMENVEFREGRVRAARRDRRKPDISGHGTGSEENGGRVVHPPGIEPGLSVPETDVISVLLWVHLRKWSGRKHYFTVGLRQGIFGFAELG